MKESFNSLKFILVGLRKFLAWVLYVVIALTLLVTGIIPGEGWLEQVTTGTVAFLGTNIGEHLIGLGKEWIKNKKFDDVAEILKNGKNN